MSHNVDLFSFPFHVIHVEYTKVNREQNIAVTIKQNDGTCINCY